MRSSLAALFVLLGTGGVRADCPPCPKGTGVCIVDPARPGKNYCAKGLRIEGDTILVTSPPAAKLMKQLDSSQSR